MVYSKGKAKKGKIMKTYDMRFDAETMAMLQNLKGSVLKSIRFDAEALPSSAYGIAEIITSRGAYALTSTIEVADYFGALEDVAMFRLFPSTGNMPSRLMNTDMTNIPVEEMIQEIQIVNEHQELFHLGVKTYDVQVTRGIIFLLQNGGEISFEKNIWFSEMISIHKGTPLTNQFIPISEFEEDWTDDYVGKCERETIKI